MGLFDRKSVKQTTQNITNRNTAVEDVDGIVFANSENVSVTDGGAISGIQEVARQAISANQGGLSASLDFGRDALLGVGAAFEQAGNQVQRVLETTTGGSPATPGPLDNQAMLIRVGAVVLVVGIAAYAWSQR